MCGIVGYVGTKPAVPILLAGLKRVEYRGYDSAGLAFFDLQGSLQVIKRAGKLSALVSAVNGQTFGAYSGIAHTRWATHGEPTDENAHPHVNCAPNTAHCHGRLALVHNGVIENFDELKQLISARGHVLITQTDTELLAHLIGDYLDGDRDPLEALRSALASVRGTYGIALVSQEHPGKVYFARKGSPLCLGVAKHGRFVASDPASFREQTDIMLSLDDGQLGRISENTFEVFDETNVRVMPEEETITWQLEQIEKGNYPHFMLKEIHEQPVSLHNAMRGRLAPDGSVKLGGLELQAETLATVKSVDFVAAGTSLHAGMIGKILFQEISKVCAHWENASELASQQHPCFREDTVAWAISQSGMTTDVLQAMDALECVRIPCFGLVNVVGSEVAKRSVAGVYIHAGPEIGVASTKAFTAQVLVLNLISLYLRQLKKLPWEDWLHRYVADLQRLPKLVEQTLERTGHIKTIAEKYAGYPNFLFLGRGVNHPTALEGALKLKEIAYVNAIGYPAGEMKHGPIALIDDGFPTLVLAPSQDDNYGRILGNIQEIRARKGRVIVVATDGDERIGDNVDDVITIPPISYYLTPILAAVPLQLFAYYVALLRGHDPDHPRSLAKSVTVP